MTSLAHDPSDVSPSLIAGLLLGARTFSTSLNLPHPTVLQVLETTGASRSRAYERRDEILGLLQNLRRPVGRPRAVSSAATVDNSALSEQALRFLVDHPGAICGGQTRRRYSDAFRCFVLDLYQQHAKIELPTLARAVCVPVGTLKDWLTDSSIQTEPSLPKPTEAEQVTTPRIEMLLAAWDLWEGNFIAFCDHAQVHLRIPYGRTLIANILKQHGVRIPNRRSGRSPDEKALRSAFETFFAGAHWVGDGTPTDVQLNGQNFRFNLELMVDAHTDAMVGASIRDEEDSAAVVEAFDDGVQTTSTEPLCLLLDNRPSNHTDEVSQAIDDTTLRMRSTRGRAQNKAHVEGAFGLFVQHLPPLHIDAQTPKQLARQILMLVVMTFFRTLNHRPRIDRGGRSRVELYFDETPTAKEIDQARAALAERCRKQEQARQTLKARTDPLVRDAIDRAFARLDLADPDGNIRAAIARYPLNAVLAGIATFEGKRTQKTLPDCVDGRYLLGIVRNISLEDEGSEISEVLLRERLAVRDHMLADLQQAHDQIIRATSDPPQRLKTLIDQARQTSRCLDRLFWLQTAADHICAQPQDQHTPFLRIATRRIHATYAVPYKQRLAAARFLTNKVVQLV